MKVLLLRDIIRDGPFQDVYVFIFTQVVERCDEVEIIEVEAEESGTWSENNTFEKELYSGNICYWGVYFTLVVDDISAYCETDAVWVIFWGRWFSHI